MSGGGADVRIKLVVDDNDQQTTEKLRRDLHDSNEELEKGKGEGKSLGSELLKVSLYTEAIKAGARLVAEGMHQAWEMADHFREASMEAADEMNQQVRASAGLMSLMDRGQHSLDTIRDYAKDVREELSDMGTAAGESTQSMQEMFDKVIERGSRSTEEAKELVNQMAIVGKVVPQGMEGLAQGFNMMELGIVRARNPLVQLIASTGVLKGNAHQVAEALKHMSPAEQIEKANDAIKRQADILQKSGDFLIPTLPELKASFGNLREGFLEAVGQPLLDHVIPPLSELRDYLLAHKEEIAEYGAEIGQEMGKVIDVVVESTEGIYKGILKNWHEISSEFNKTFGDWRAAWDYATSQSEGIEKTLSGVGDGLRLAFSMISSVVKEAGEEAMKWNDVVHFRAMGTTATGVQVDATTQRANTSFGTSSDRIDLEKSIDDYKKLAASIKVNPADQEAFIRSMNETFEARKQWAAGVRSDISGGTAKQITDDINGAMKSKDAADSAYVFNLIASSDTLTRALYEGGLQVDGGFDALSKVIEERSPDLYKKIEKMRNTLHGVGIQGNAPSVNFYGANINIKQDFRDQDPDRILRTFREDLGRAATSRRQSNRSTAFGL